MRTTSPMAKNTRKMMSMGTLSATSSPDSGTMVATMASTSSIMGMARITFIAVPWKGKRYTRGRFASTLRSLMKAGNIGM